MEEFSKVTRKQRRKQMAEEYDETSPTYSIKLAKRFNDLLRQFDEDDQLISASTVIADAVVSLFGLNGKIHDIVSYGLGSVSNSKTSMYQFALIFKLSQSLGCTLTLYDPAFSSADITLFESLKCILLAEDDRGRRKVLKTTLFFLPHCPRFVFENLLRTNWGPSLSKCILFGDNLSIVAEKCPTRLLKKRLPFINECQSFVDIFPVENNFKFVDVFNDLAVHVFLPNKLALVAPKTWAQRVAESDYEDDSREDW